MKKQDCTSGPSYCPSCGRELSSTQFCILCNFDIKSKKTENKLKNKK